MRNAVAMLFVSALLAACGQRGPLYLPGEEREQVGTSTPATAPAPTPSSDADESERNTRRNRTN